MPTKAKNYAQIAKKYAQDVVSGKIVAGQYIVMACQRQLDDLKNPPEGYHFDPVKAERPCILIENLCHIKGKWAGKPLVLEPWQIFMLVCVYGWVNDEGMRRFKTAYTEVARKNAKSTLSSGVGIFQLAADGEGGAEVYSAATAKDQAKIVWADAKRMVDRNPDLRDHFGVKTTAHTIEVPYTASVFKALSRDQGGNLDGLNVHAAIVDELHGHKTRDIWDVLETATGAREQPLIWAITTAGFNRAGICYEVRDYAIKVLKGAAEDAEFFAMVFTIDPGDDWTDENVWIKANPNLGVSVSLEDLRRKARKAMEQSSAQNNFLTKHLNVWVNAETAWMNMQKWDAVGDPELTLDDPRLVDWDCYMAVDLASKSDIASIGLVFHRDWEEYAIFTRNFLPEEAVNDSRNSQYNGWVHDGHLIATEGNVTDYAMIEQEIIELASRFNVRGIGFDPFQATYIMTRLSERGLPIIQFGNTVKNMSEPMKELERLVISSKLRHPCDPVLTWMMSNVTAKVDAKDNIFPRKEFPENKIDGVVAIIMALGQALNEQVNAVSVYEDRGLMVI